jgi:hypothetical protein
MIKRLGLAVLFTLALATPAQANTPKRPNRSDIDRRRRDVGGIWKLDAAGGDASPQYCQPENATGMIRFDVGIWKLDAAGGDATYVLVDRRKLDDRRHLCSPTCICAQDADREATHSEGSTP